MQYKTHLQNSRFLFHRAGVSSGICQQSSGCLASHRCSFQSRSITNWRRYASCCRIRASDWRRPESHSECRQHRTPLTLSLTAGLAAVCLLVTQPAHAELSSAISPVRQSGAGSTVTVDRAWLESLLLDELGSRINSLSDQELMAMLEQLVRSRQPGSSQRSAIPDNSRGLSNPLQGMSLAWPWAQRQAPELQGQTSNAGDNVLERITGSLPGWLKGPSDAVPDASAANQGQIDSDAPPSASYDSPTQPQDAPRSSAPLPEGVSSRGSQPMSMSERPTVGAVPPGTPSSGGSTSERHSEAPVANEAEAARAAGQARSPEAADGTPRREEADLTGSLLEASGLPLRLREDGLPEASSAAGEQRLLQGKVFLERAWQVAGTAAAAVAAALTTGLNSIPADSRFQNLQTGSDGSLPAVVDIAPQIALLAGLGVGIYTLLRLVGFDNSDKSGDVDPADEVASNLPRQPTATIQPRSQAESGQTARKLPSAWDLLKLVPNTLLGFPVSISSPSAPASSVMPEPPPDSYAQGGPDVMRQPPRGPPSPSGPILSPGRRSDAGSEHSQQPDTILWRREEAPNRSRQAAEPAADVLWVRDEGAQAPRGGASVPRDSAAPDSTVLWRRDESSAPRSLTFPGPSLNSARIGTASVPLQNRYQNGLPDPVSDEADPWTAPQQLQPPVNPDTATAEEWVRMHAELQQRGEDPWREPLGNGAQTAQPISGRPGTAEVGGRSAAVGSAHDKDRGEDGRRHGAVSGVGQNGDQESGRPRSKARVRDKSVLYNNVEQVPYIRQQSAYLRK